MIPRFLSVDPVTAYGDPVGQFHRYRYANNNPYQFKDPDGRLACRFGDTSCHEARRNLEQRGIFPLQAGSDSGSKSKEGDCLECDEVRATRAGIMRDGGERLKEAGIFSAKFAALNFGGGPLGKLLGRIGRLLGLAGKDVKWTLGTGKTEARWASQLERRGWTPDQVTAAIERGKSFPANNLVNKGNTATRYVNPETGRSVVIDDVTREVIHVGGDGFKY